MNDLKHEYDRAGQRPWYKRGCGWFDFCLILIALVVAYVVSRHG